MPRIDQPLHLLHVHMPICHPTTTCHLHNSTASATSTSLNCHSLRALNKTLQKPTIFSHHHPLPTHMEKREEDQKMINGGGKQEDELPAMALNHVSRLCRSVKESMDFYVKVLGFVLIQRPQVLHFDGAWLFNHGVGIHLVQAKGENYRQLPDCDHLDPMDNHISFQCEDMGAMWKRLKKLNIKHMKRTMKDDENGAAIDQLFFNDPDGFMIEICNCENLKLVPAGSLGHNIKLPLDHHNPPLGFGINASHDNHD